MSSCQWAHSAHVNQHKVAECPHLATVQLDTVYVKTDTLVAKYLAHLPHKQKHMTSLLFTSQV